MKTRDTNTANGLRAGIPCRLFSDTPLTDTDSNQYLLMNALGEFSQKRILDISIPSIDSDLFDGTPSRKTYAGGKN